MPTSATRGRILLVGATGRVGRAVHAVLAPRCQAVTAGPDGCDRFLELAARDHLRDGGSVTLVISIATQHTIPGASGFTMANAAIEGFARAAAIEMPRRIRINVVSPGVLAESPPPVFGLFAGFEPVPAARVAQAYLRSVEGGQTGQVFTVW